MLGKLDCSTLTTLNSQQQGTIASYLTERHYKPTPRVLAGTALRRMISSCIDLSDGLLGDIQHIMRASKCGAHINVESLPISPALAALVSGEQAFEYALSAGDDYELCFSLPQKNTSELELALNAANVNFTCIGQIVGGSTLILTHNGNPYHSAGHSFEHQFDH